jgi:hypothetical protein
VFVDGRDLEPNPSAAMLPLCGCPEGPPRQRYINCTVAPSTTGQPDGGIVPSATIVEVLY